MQGIVPLTQSGSESTLWLEDNDKDLNKKSGESKYAFRPSGAPAARRSAASRTKAQLIRTRPVGFIRDDEEIENIALHPGGLSIENGTSSGLKSRPSSRSSSFGTARTSVASLREDRNMTLLLRKMERKSAAAASRRSFRPRLSRESSSRPDVHLSEQKVALVEAYIRQMQETLEELTSIAIPDDHVPTTHSLMELDSQERRYNPTLLPASNNLYRDLLQDSVEDDITPAGLHAYLDTYKRAARKLPAVVTIQSWWRGTSTRRRYLAAQRVREAYQRRFCAPFLALWLEGMKAEQYYRTSILRKTFGALKQQLAVFQALRSGTTLATAGKSTSNLTRMRGQADGYFKLIETCRANARQRMKRDHFALWVSWLADRRKKLAELDLLMKRAKTHIDRIKHGLILGMWHRYTKVKMSERIGEAEPIFDKHIPLWDGWIVSHYDWGNKKVRASQMGPLSNKKYYWAHWREYIDYKRAKHSKIDLAETTFLETLFKRTFGNWREEALWGRAVRHHLHTLFRGWINYKRRKLMLRECEKIIRQRHCLRWERLVVAKWKQYNHYRRIVSTASLYSQLSEPFKLMWPLSLWHGDVFESSFVDSFRTWAHYAKRRVVFEKFLVEYNRLAQRQLLAAAFIGWKNNIRENKLQHEKLHSERENPESSVRLLAENDEGLEADEEPENPFVDVTRALEGEESVAILKRCREANYVPEQVKEKAKIKELTAIFSVASLRPHEGSSLVAEPSLRISGMYRKFVVGKFFDGSYDHLFWRTIVHLLKAVKLQRREAMKQRMDPAYDRVQVAFDASVTTLKKIKAWDEFEMDDFKDALAKRVKQQRSILLARLRRHSYQLATQDGKIAARNLHIIRPPFTIDPDQMKQLEMAYNAGNGERGQQGLDWLNAILASGHALLVTEEAQQDRYAVLTALLQVLKLPAGWNVDYEREGSANPGMEAAQWEKTPGSRKLRAAVEEGKGIWLQQHALNFHSIDAKLVQLLGEEAAATTEAYDPTAPTKTKGGKKGAKKGKKGGKKGKKGGKKGSHGAEEVEIMPDWRLSLENRWQIEDAYTNDEFIVLPSQSAGTDGSSHSAGHSVGGVEEEMEMDSEMAAKSLRFASASSQSLATSHSNASSTSLLGGMDRTASSRSLLANDLKEAQKQQELDVRAVQKREEIEQVLPLVAPRLVKAALPQDTSVIDMLVKTAEMPLSAEVVSELTTLFREGNEALEGSLEWDGFPKSTLDGGGGEDDLADDHVSNSSESVPAVDIEVTDPAIKAMVERYANSGMQSEYLNFYFDDFGGKKSQNILEGLVQAEEVLDESYRYQEEEEEEGEHSDSGSDSGVGLASQLMNMFSKAGSRKNLFAGEPEDGEEGGTTGNAQPDNDNAEPLLEADDEEAPVLDQGDPLPEHVTGVHAGGHTSSEESSSVLSSRSKVSDFNEEELGELQAMGGVEEFLKLPKKQRRKHLKKKYTKQGREAESPEKKKKAEKAAAAGKVSEGG